MVTVLYARNYALLVYVIELLAIVCDLDYEVSGCTSKHLKVMQPHKNHGNLHRDGNLRRVERSTRKHSCGKNYCH